MDRVLVVAYSGVIDSLFSTVIRAWETYGVKDVLIIYSDRMKSEGKKAVSALEELSRSLGLGVRVVGEVVTQHPAPLGSGREPVAAELRRELDKLARDGEVIVSPTPGSRRLAMQLGLVTGGLAARLATSAIEGAKPQGVPRAGRLRLIHVDFCFGPWNGLYYPLVPRSCNPLIEIDLGQGTTPPGRVAERLKTYWKRILEDDRFPVARRLPPLRRRVAALAYWLNRVTDCSVALLEGGEAVTGEWSLGFVMRINEREYSAEVDNVCDPLKWGEGVTEFARLVERLGEELQGDGGQLVRFSGLERPSGDEVSGRLILDTSLVYNGVHNLVYSREVSAILPQCLIAEVTRAYAENMKQRAPLYRKLTSLLAYAALMELLEAGSVVAPSPLGACDNAIPEMSPVILSVARPATADKGAYQYWRSHPATQRLTEPVLVGRGVEVRGPGAASYAVLQAIVVAIMASELARSDREDGLEVRLFLKNRDSGETVSLDPLREYSHWSRVASF